MPNRSAAQVRATSGGSARMSVPVGPKIEHRQRGSGPGPGRCARATTGRRLAGEQGHGQQRDHAAACEADVVRSVGRNSPVPGQVDHRAGDQRRSMAAPAAAATSSRSEVLLRREPCGAGQAGGEDEPGDRRPRACSPRPKPRLTRAARPPVRLVATLTRNTAGTRTNQCAPGGERQRRDGERSRRPERGDRRRLGREQHRADAGGVGTEEQGERQRPALLGSRGATRPVSGHADRLPWHFRHTGRTEVRLVTAE